MIAAERFARKVHDSWGVGIQSPCGGTGALLFLSKVDRAVYISRGQALDPILTQYRIGRIVQAMKPLLQQEQYGKAILKGLEEIDSFIAEGPAHATEGSGETIMAASLFASCLGLFALAARRHRRNQRQYAEVSSHLNHLDEQRAQALQGQYKTTSCPICLEKFDCTTSSPMKGSDGLSVKLLRCGHVFDESCWSDWVNRGQAYDKCPICREDVKAPPAKETTATRPRDNTQHTSDRWEYSFPAVRDGQPASRSSTAQEGGRTMRLFLNERNFRISRLGSRYPNYIRPQQIRSWTSPTFTGPLARDPSFIRLDPAREMQNSTRQTHGGSGFGGGRSSGGGGGRW